MPDADGRQIAQNTEAIRNMREDVQGLTASVGRLGARIGSVEGELSTLLTERRDERRQAKQRQDTIKTWLQILSLSIGVGSLMLTGALVLAAFYFNH